MNNSSIDESGVKAVLDSQIPLIEITDENGKCQKIYLNGKTEGFENCQILNLATPLIRSLMFKKKSSESEKSYSPEAALQFMTIFIPLPEVNSEPDENGFAFNRYKPFRFAIKFPNGEIQLLSTSTDLQTEEEELAEIKKFALEVWNGRYFQAKRVNLQARQSGS